MLETSLRLEAIAGGTLKTIAKQYGEHRKHISWPALANGVYPRIYPGFSIGRNAA